MIPNDLHSKIVAALTDDGVDLNAVILEVEETLKTLRREASAARRLQNQYFKIFMLEVALLDLRERITADENTGRI